jgi:hypothetical protein
MINDNINKIKNKQVVIFKTLLFFMKEEFEDTKGVIRIRKSKNNRQHNGQKKKDKRTNNDLQNIHIQCLISTLDNQSNVLRQSGAKYVHRWVRIRFVVFNVTFHNISAISWRSVLLMEEIR